MFSFRSLQVHFVTYVFLFSCLVVPTSGAEPTRKFIAADSSKQRIAIVDEAGKVAWEHRIGPLHDLHVLANGHILCQLDWTHVVELEPESHRIVWEYDAQKSAGNEDRKIEIHAFQRLPGCNTMIAESGRARIIEASPEGKIVKEFPLQVSNPHPHRDTRLARKLDNGRYLVCHEGDGAVREYDADGKVVWEYAVPLFGRDPKPGHDVNSFGNQCFSALRLPNGNTLVATGNGHSVIEVTPAKEIVWQLSQNDLPGIQLAWVTTLQQLPSSNLVIGNCHAGEKNPQIIEITREKEVVWSFHDFQTFGDALTNSQILAVDGRPLD